MAILNTIIVYIAYFIPTASPPLIPLLLNPLKTTRRGFFVVFHIGLVPQPNNAVMNIGV